MSRSSLTTMTMAMAAIVLLLSPVPAVTQESEVEGLTTALAAERAEYAAADALSVRFTLSNGSGETLNVLKWNTPLEGFNGDMFTVERDGEPVAYTGRTVKRGAPRPEDYVTLAPGESVSEVVDLAEAYAIYEQGDYSVVFKSSFYDVGREQPAALAGALFAKTDFQPKAVSSNAVTLKLTEEREAPPEPEAPPAAAAEGEAEAKAPAFVQCSTSQRNTLTNALDEAKTITAGAILCLAVSESKRPSSDRYKTWFGAYNATRWSTVQDNFNDILDALSNQQITFHCDCNEPYYAYVYKNNPYHIWLCNAFWPAPMTGTDSKAGTIVHEVSHFTVVADTDDHAYGHANCKNLANTNPSNAIDNADSHEYFAENTPSLSCGLEHVAASLVVILLLVAGERLRQRRLSVAPGLADGPGMR